MKKRSKIYYILLWCREKKFFQENYGLISWLIDIEYENAQILMESLIKFSYCSEYRWGIFLNDFHSFISGFTSVCNWRGSLEIENPFKASANVKFNFFGLFSEIYWFTDKISIFKKNRICDKSFPSKCNVQRFSSFKLLENPQIT